jgi:hypothetical protein
MIGADANEAIDRLILRELAAEFDQTNWVHFKRAMKPPVLELIDDATHLGTWQATSRKIGISRHYARTAPWGAVLEVLRHEIAHQYVAEILTATDEPPHGPAFQSVCRRMGLDPRASGVSSSAEGGEGAVLRKIRKLLALAESQNRHEAEAAMNAAQRLMLQHNVAVAGTLAEDGYTVRAIGPARVRHARWEKALVGLLSAHFFVRVVWVQTLDRTSVRIDRHGREQLRVPKVAEALGTPGNLEIAEYVFSFLAQTGERLWIEHRRARGLRGNSERGRFLAGVIAGFRRKLDEGVRTCAEEGLVWLGDAALADFSARRFPRLTHRGLEWQLPTAEFRAGVEAGSSIVLHKPIATGPSNERRQIGQDLGK